MWYPGSCLINTIDAKPTFNGVSLDFGVRSPLGGSAYFINQTVSGFTDRRAVQVVICDTSINDFTIMSNAGLRHTVQCSEYLHIARNIDRRWNRQMTITFFWDRRRSPVLDVRNAVNGTTVSIATLLQAGATTKRYDSVWRIQRTAVSDLAQVGMTNHLNEKWNAGTDFTDFEHSSGLPQ